MSILGDSFERAVVSSAQSASKQGEKAADKLVDGTPQPTPKVASDETTLSKRADIHTLSATALDFANGKEGLGGYFHAPSKKGFFGKLGGMFSGDKNAVLADYLSQISEAAKGGGDVNARAIQLLAAQAPASGEDALARQARALSYIQSLSAPEATPFTAIDQQLSAALPQLDAAPSETFGAAQQSALASAHLGIAKQIAELQRDANSQLIAQAADQGLKSQALADQRAAIASVGALSKSGESPVASLSAEALTKTQGLSDAAAQVQWSTSYLQQISRIAKSGQAPTSQLSGQLADDALQAAAQAGNPVQAARHLQAGLGAIQTVATEQPAVAAAKARQGVLDQALALDGNAKLDANAKLGWMNAYRPVMRRLSAGDAASGAFDRFASPATNETFPQAYVRLKTAQLLAEKGPDQALGELTKQLQSTIEVSGWQQQVPYASSYADVIGSLAKESQTPNAGAIAGFMDQARQGLSENTLAGYERAHAYAVAANVYATSSAEEANAQALSTLSGKIKGYIDNRGKTEINTINQWSDGWLGAIQGLSASGAGAHDAVIHELASAGRAQYAAQATGVGTFEQLKGTVCGINTLASNPAPEARTQAAREMLAKARSFLKGTDQPLDTQAGWIDSWFQPIGIVAKAAGGPNGELSAQLADRAHQGYLAAPKGLATYETNVSTLRALELLNAGKTPSQATTELATKIHGFMFNKDQTVDTKSIWVNQWLGTLQPIAKASDLPHADAIDQMIARSRQAYATTPAGLATYETSTSTVEAIEALSGGKSEMQAINALAQRTQGFLEESTELDTKSIWMDGYLGTAQAIAGTSSQPNAGLINQLIEQAHQAYVATPKGLRTYEQLQGATRATAYLSGEGEPTAKGALNDLSSAMLGWVDNRAKTEWTKRADWMVGYLKAMKPIAEADGTGEGQAAVGMIDQALDADAAAPATRTTYQQLYTSYLGINALTGAKPADALSSLAQKAVEFDAKNSSDASNKLGWEKAYLQTIQLMAAHTDGPTAKPIAVLAGEGLEAAEKGGDGAYEKMLGQLRTIQQVADGQVAPEFTDGVLKSGQMEAEARINALNDTDVLATMPYDENTLIAIAQRGALEARDNTRIAIGSVTQKSQESGGQTAFLLSEAGKRKLASSDAAYQIDREIAQGVAGVPATKGTMWNAVDGLRFGAEDALPTSLDLETDVDHVLMDAYRYPDFLEAYARATMSGNAPETIAGKPYHEFFQPSEDLHNETAVAAFQRDVPGFSSQPEDAQRTTAALAERVMNSYPQAVPAPIRRRVAFSFTRYEDLGRETNKNFDPVGELRRFYHGTRAAQAIKDKGFVIGRNNRYDKGIYYTNPTASATYAMGRAGNAVNFDQPAEILSGDVALGKRVVGSNMQQGGDYQSRLVPRAQLGFNDMGDYGVTKDPQRLTLKAITHYDPTSTANLPSVVPELLKAYAVAPDWAKKLLGKLPADQARPLYEQQLQSPDPEIKSAAQAMLDSLQTPAAAPAAAPAAPAT